MSKIEYRFGELYEPVDYEISVYDENVVVDFTDFFENSGNIRIITDYKETNKRYKKINQYSLSGKFIRQFKNFQNIYNECGYWKHVVECCDLKIYSSHGFIWRYADDFDMSDLEIKKESDDLFQPKEVNQYSLEGKYIKTYNSLLEAGNENNIDPDCISLCATGKLKSSGNYQWRYKSDVKNNNDIKSLRWKQYRSVCQYDRDGNFIRMYDSIAQAEKELGIKNSHISNCCKKKCPTSNGFIWRYSDETEQF